MLETDFTSGFSVLPENLAEQYRQRYKYAQVLKTLVFRWQRYSLALPMVAVQKVLPISPSLQQQLLEGEHLSVNDVVAQVINLPIGAADNLDEQADNDFILLFTLPDERLLALPITLMPNVIEFPLPSFSSVAGIEDNEKLPFRNWVKFVAHHIHNEEFLYGTVFYLLDLDQIQALV